LLTDSIKSAGGVLSVLVFAPSLRVLADPKLEEELSVNLSVGLCPRYLTSGI
jgi:hypothetical protein